MTLLSVQLPFEFFPSDNDHREIEKFKLTCSHCGTEHDEKVLTGEIGYATIKKVVVTVDYTCPCGHHIDSTFRYVADGKSTAIYEMVKPTQWTRIRTE